MYNKSVEDAYKALNTSKEGLSAAEVEKRLNEFGKNELTEGDKVTMLQKFFNQFKDLMIIILIVASVISGLVGELSDTFIILAVVLLNAVIGVLQEAKAEKALEALKKMSLPFAKVKRDGVVSSIKSEEIVPGDIVILDAGDFVPADLRLTEVSSLKIEESALTGESVPTEKSNAIITEENIVLNDMKNIAFSGTSVVYGRGEGVVISTGMKTEVGKIATLIHSVEDEQTPLQKNIAKTSKIITIGILIIAAITFIAGLLRGKEVIDMFMMAISLSVAAIPEGLPAIITIVLAIGVQKMAKENAIIRKLSAVETLGCTEIICTDKTGTLTQNRMTVREVFTEGEFKAKETLSKEFIAYMVLCNDTRFSVDAGEPVSIGDPTENALVNYGFYLGHDKNELEVKHPRVFDLPFDSERKMMSVVNVFDGKQIAITKGAPDVLIQFCTHIYKNGEVFEIQESDHEQLKAANKKLAEQALRVLALAYKPISGEAEYDTIEQKLIFMGLVGMIDPPREEVKGAVASCFKAGIRTIMITGDHQDTAFAIAKELGITQDPEAVLTGSALNLIPDDVFEKTVDQYAVYARVSPEHKLKIVKAWKKKGKIVAMTGDGVNDAPALKVSDIGIGMGITGTDVTKSVSNMILADDNFATIVVAVEEGRHIYGNITKAIQFLLSCNLGEVLVVFIATMCGWTALFPVQLLWINLVTDTLPALALGVDKTKVSVMKEKPRLSSDSIFSNGVGFSIVYQGILEGTLTLGAFIYALNMYGQEVAITVAFMSLALVQLAHSMNVRSNSESIFKLGITANKSLIAAILISAMFQISTVLITPLNKVFKIVPLNGEQWLLVASVAFGMIAIVEVIKIFIRKFSR
jgi:Ca2+-transporting ATPase